MERAIFSNSARVITVWHPPAEASPDFAESPGHRPLTVNTGASAGTAAADGGGGTGRSSSSSAAAAGVVAGGSVAGFRLSPSQNAEQKTDRQEENQPTRAHIRTPPKTI